jgi:hypothetical protein
MFRGGDSSHRQFRNLLRWYLVQRPTLITVISLLFCVAAAYLWSLGATLLIAPGTFPLVAGRHFMYGMELAGPYMMLIFGTAYALVGWGLFRLHNWARWSAMLIIVIGVASLVPSISTAELGIPVFWYGLQIALRVALAWYLAQAPAVIDAFAAK